MARIEESVEINCPAEKVFTFTTDATTWNQWQSILPEAEQTSEGPVGVGTTFRGICLLMGRTMKWTARATEYELATKFGKAISSGSVFLEQHNTYYPTMTGTRFTLVYDMKVSGPLILLSPMLVHSVRKELKKSLSNLKQILET
jgi:hypothetical protein